MIFVVTPAGNDFHIRLLLKTSVPLFEPVIPNDGAILKADENLREIFMYWCKFEKPSSSTTRRS